MSQRIGIGLVGYGGIGRMHALCYRMLPLAYPHLPLMPEVVAVATASEASAGRARHELGVAAVTALEALLNHPDVAVIDCCAPTGAHAPIAQAALRAGKTLYCEKPLTAAPEESGVIVALARERGLAGGVHYHFRAAPALQEAHRLIGAGLLGEVIGFHLRYHRASNLKRDRPISWRFAGPGGGVLVDMGSHLIDLVLHLLGPIAAVSGRLRVLVRERPGASGQPAPVTADDDAWLAVELAGGGAGTLSASKVVPGAGDDLRVEAYGTNGALLFDTRDPNSLLVAEGPASPPGGRSIATLSRGIPPASLPGAETPTGTLLWHLAAIAGFFDALGRGVPPPTNLEAGLAVDRVLAAAQAAAAGSSTIRVN
jgi:predicted dehydrogenase